ncbi:GerAB/ArcD/ProY family transporter [Paenibacillus sedimenti]|uniref:GerAB/ArcD/ProY family transporter n=1 Tax=Paenibacillus sedimenti TaxID=2770274 RepID=A0A926KNE1_9BACL|nr:endospore germination permease [Paenibacillus sedimenti]MBD0381034.1 GerAB/ArcD/ProY family transporter [Paenibacillus sedimenti]
MIAKEQISSAQMSVLFFSFMTGSSIVNIPGPLIGYAKNGAWISLLLSISAGLFFLSCILYLYRRFPDLTLIEYSRALVGNWVTVLLAIPFISFQFHMTSGIVLDIGLFMTSSMMRQTPLHLFIFFVFVVVALAVRSGIETIARMIFVPMAGVLCFIILILVLAFKNYEIDHLFPIMPDGVKPVLLGAYFSYGFPYVELVLMAMLLPYVRKESQTNVKMGMYLALLINGFFLIAVTLSTILVFGPMAGERNYSMFEVARIIDLLEVIQRIESLIGISLIMASFIKATITLFILNLTFTKLFKLRDDRILILPITVACYFFSLLQIGKGAAHWIHSVSVIHPLWATFAYMLPLIVVTSASVIRKKTPQ